MLTGRGLDLLGFHAFFFLGALTFILAGLRIINFRLGRDGSVFMGTGLGSSSDSGGGAESELANLVSLEFSAGSDILVPRITDFSNYSHTMFKLQEQKHCKRCRVC
jgi:hypothetical protein